MSFANDRAYLASQLVDHTTEELRLKQITARMFPAGSAVYVRLRHGQKNLSAAEVAGHSSWKPGYVIVRLLDSKAGSRQKFRDLHYTDVFHTWEWMP